METKYITIPFDVERAKRISNGEEEGKTITRDGRNARIVCFDVKDEDSILALIESKYGTEIPSTHKSSGSFFINSEDPNDLLLSVPEWATFKDGDIIYCEVDNGNNSVCKWVSILKGKVECFDGDLYTNEYATYIIDPNTFKGEMSFDGYSDNIDTIVLANESQKQYFIELLKKSKDPKAKECLKRFFWIEETTNHSNTEKTGKEFELKPFDKVLVRDYYGSMWKATFFSHKTDNEKFPFSCGGIEWRYCIPYEGNEHLLGTSNDPE